MSGGSYEYSYRIVEEFAGRMTCEKSALRMAFRAHLKKVSKAMHDIEWVDSCDYGEGDEMEAIRDCLGLSSDPDWSRVEAAMKALETEIERAFGPKEASK